MGIKVYLDMASVLLNFVYGEWGTRIDNLLWSVGRAGVFNLRSKSYRYYPQRVSHMK